MKALARSHVWWAGLDHDVEVLVKNCSACAIVKQSPPKSSPASMDVAKSAVAKDIYRLCRPVHRDVSDSSGRLLEVGRSYRHEPDDCR